jgi:hypothetical protein
MECMCLKCGISTYLDGDVVSSQEKEPENPDVLSLVFCPECGGHLLVIGRAGEESHYKTE